SINGEKKYESGYIQYDSNYISKYTDERGKVTNYTFNQANGNINSVTAQGSDNNSTSDDITTTYTYVGNTSRIASVTTDTSKVEYTYTPLGLVKTISHNTTSDNTDVVYTFNYDEFGNVKDISVGNHQLASYSYGAKNGTLNSTTYKISSTKNETLNYEYDELERVTAIYEGTVKKYSWEYGNEGKIGRFVDHNTDGTIRYSYDLNGNVTEEERSDGTYLYNSYKKDSSLLSKTGYETTSNKSSTSFSYNPREEVESVTWNTNNSTSLISYTRDFLRRIKTSTYKVNSNAILTTTYNYLEVDKDVNVQGNDTTTNVLSSVVNRYNNTDYTYSYDFDDFGNISKITYGNYENTYEYDKLNQLTRENNEELGKTYVFTYDKGGNITSAKTYNYTEEAVSGDPISTETYTYGDSDWKDLLTSYNNHAITYDNIGNPLTYHDGKTFTWNFRRLEKIVDGNTTIEYKYNQDGIRISKKVGSTTTNYVVSGNRILQETTGTNTIIYEYDALGNASSFVYNGTRYIYVRNGTNDVVGILNSSGSLVASYKYDGWGNCTVANTSGTDIGNINPIRYRSYYYDSETGYYYLNSRYYDSNVGRFISPDISLNDDTTGNNNFVYCGNNPILYKDTTGEWFYVALAGGLFSAAAQIVSNVLPVAEGETQPLWYDGALPAFAGGFVSGMFTGVSALTTISKPLQIILSSSADMVGAVVEETMSYVLKEKELSKNNVINSAASIVVDVAVSTKISNKINVDKFVKRLMLIIINL
ncbi:MAG: RHS repeat-associated core domain-containing protein, partial [Erysipelotrichaceae bacterium]|nr:RHS repeat-associated core domain-containing protein [Erysipelotrichaceae bacterium]